MEDSQPRSAAELVGRLIDTIGAEDKEGLISFFSQWRQFVGTDLSAHSRPVDIRHGSLIVQVDHPGWAQKLQLARGKIIGKIAQRHRALDIRNIHVYVSDDFPPVATAGTPAKPPARRPTRQPTRPEKMESGAANEPNKEIDSEMEASFSRLAEALKKKERQNPRD